MPKLEPNRAEEPKSAAQTLAGAPGLSSGVRRHLGQALRNVYAEAPTAPADARIDALIERLGGSKA